MDTLDNENSQKLATNFVCKHCDYICCRRNDFEKHELTAKHQKTIKWITLDNENSQNSQAKFVCECGNKYLYSSGLSKHRKKCIINKPTLVQSIDSNLVVELLKQNQELQKNLIELSKEKTITTNNICNKTFNLNVFLNEDCKDAISINDFVDSINVRVQDLEETGRLGFVEGISKVVIKNLNNLEIHTRPIHCSDYKREILYIKNNNQWIKETDNKDKMKTVIKLVANKNMKQIPEWVKLHPDCFNSSSRSNDKYLQIVSNSMSGGTIEEQERNIQQIIRKLSKEVVILK